jgi:hypothetical protein
MYIINLKDIIDALGKEDPKQNEVLNDLISTMNGMDK